MTPDRYRPVDTDEVLRRVDTHARVGAALLGGLGEVGREGDDEAFTSELVTAARNAAEHELADVAYDLARACLAAHEGCSKDVIWIARPRELTEIHEAVQALAARVGAPVESALSITPGDQADLRPILSAIELCRHLEGDSERVRHLEAHVPAIQGQWDEVERRARALADSTSKPNWIRNARLLQALASIRRADGASALTVLTSVREEHGDDRILLSNLCCAYALTGEREKFFETARRFADCDPAECDSYDWSQSMNGSLSWFATRLECPRSVIAEAFGLEHSE